MAKVPHSRTAWRDDLVVELQKLTDVYGSLLMDATDFLDTELVLTLLKDYFPNEDPSVAWAILNGLPFPALETLPVAGKRAIARVRNVLRRTLRRSVWERNLQQYQQIVAPYPFYKVTPSGITLSHTSVLPIRGERMREVFTTVPPRRIRTARYAPQGRYRFMVDREVQEVEIPRRVAEMAHGETIKFAESSNLRKPIDIPLKVLQEEAMWMDQVAPPGSVADQSWSDRIQAVRLAAVDKNGLKPTTVLRLDQLLHLLGMVGSGKSSLLIVLCVYLARHGYQVSLILGDVASLLREQAVFEVFRQADPMVCAVPLVGRSQRVIHLNRLHVTEAEAGNTGWSHHHPGYPLLSTICPLDGLRQDVDPIALGQEPCTRLVPRGKEDTPQNRHDCPLLPCCPVHTPTRALQDAKIWLSTPASLLVSGPQAPLVDENIRNVELVMRTADVVLIDEADRVQMDFDARFAQMETLVGPNDSWLDRLYTQVTRQVYRPGRPLVGRRPVLDRWLKAHDNTQRAADQLYRWLREGSDIRSWLQSGYFTGDLLLYRVEIMLKAAGVDPAPFSLAHTNFNQNALGSVRPRSGLPQPPGAWREAVNLELVADDAPAALDTLRIWLTTTLGLPSSITPQQIDLWAHRLLIALIVGVLDHALQDVIADWEAAAQELELDRGSGGLFFQPSEELVRLVPEAPMGSVLGLQYYDAQNNGEGELRFFHIRGMGRSLLYHLHDGLQHSHDIMGPHVVLTSGTSWAPGSWRYHIAVPPTLVLLPNRKDTTADTWCVFEPLPDPDRPGYRLAVSGKATVAERERSLGHMVAALARRRSFAPSPFDAEFAEIAKRSPHRQRILLVVGSYDQARVVRDRLTREIGDTTGEQVLALIPNSDGEVATLAPTGSIQRSNLTFFPRTKARFLVAPLQAIERGHNILIGHEAAIGSVYFLARPFPQPGDLQSVVQRLNAWAIESLPSLHDPITVAGPKLRSAARQRWDDELRTSDTYKGMTDRTGLLWTQLVLVWQCIGRLLRGGVPARVHFIDAKWGEVTADLVPGRGDTEETSMLLGFERILNDALHHPDPAQRALAETLYGPFAMALARIEGVRRA